MKKYIPLFVFLAFISFAQVAKASVLYSQSTTLAPGWNIVSTPKILESHSFSLPETSDNFDIYTLNASSTTGWSTLADLGQSEFTPLFGYFINNKSLSSQILTFNYKASTTPNQRLFERAFSKAGWYSIGVSNPTYSRKTTDDKTDTNNPNRILNLISGGYDSVIDLTDDSYVQNSNSVSVGSSWKQAVSSDIDSLNDLRDNKGYAIYITQPNTLYSGFQNENIPQASVLIIANENIASTTVYASSTVKIAWSSVNTSSCTILPEGWSGNSGSQDVVVSTSTVFTVSCEGLYGGEVESYVTVKIQEPEPMFTLASSPTLTKVNTTAGGSSTTTLTYTASYVLKVTAVGTDLTFGLPASTTPAFGITSTSTKIYLNGVAVADNSVYGLAVNYSQPTGTVLAATSDAFTIARGQTIQVPITYMWTVTDPGASMFSLGLSGIKVNGTVQNFMDGLTAWRTNVQ